MMSGWAVEMDDGLVKDDGWMDCGWMECEWMDCGCGRILELLVPAPMCFCSLPDALEVRLVIFLSVDCR